MPLTRLLALALALLRARGPRRARANQQAMLSIMMDDDQLLYRGDAARDVALRRMKHARASTTCA